MELEADRNQFMHIRPLP